MWLWVWVGVGGCGWVGGCGGVGECVGVWVWVWVWVGVWVIGHKPFTKVHRNILKDQFHIWSIPNIILWT